MAKIPNPASDSKNPRLLRAFYNIVHRFAVVSEGQEGGAGSAGAGNQYIILEMPDGKKFKVLHDGEL